MFFKKDIDFYFFICYNIDRDSSHKMPVWWNWQTRRTQNPKVAIPCRFDPDYRHQKKATAVQRTAVVFFLRQVAESISRLS